MTRLEILCIAHKQQGGTIFQFNEKYKVDFLKMEDVDFIAFINGMDSDLVRWCTEHKRWEVK